MSDGANSQSLPASAIPSSNNALFSAMRSSSSKQMTNAQLKEQVRHADNMIVVVTVIEDGDTKVFAARARSSGSGADEKFHIKLSASFSDGLNDFNVSNWLRQDIEIIDFYNITIPTLKFVRIVDAIVHINVWLQENVLPALDRLEIFRRDNVKLLRALHNAQATAAATSAAVPQFEQPQQEHSRKDNDNDSDESDDDDDCCISHAAIRRFVDGGGIGTLPRGFNINSVRFFLYILDGTQAAQAALVHAIANSCDIDRHQRIATGTYTSSSSANVSHSQFVVAAFDRITTSISSLNAAVAAGIRFNRRLANKTTDKYTTRDDRLNLVQDQLDDLRKLSLTHSAEQHGNLIRSLAAPLARIDDPIAAAAARITSIGNNPTQFRRRNRPFDTPTSVHDRRGTRGSAFCTRCGSSNHDTSVCFARRHAITHTWLTSPASASAPAAPTGNFPGGSATNTARRM